MPYSYEYPKADNTLDIALCRIKNRTLQLSTVVRKDPPYEGMRVLPGGFLDIDTNETLEDAALRELKEETHATGIALRQLGTYGDPDRDPRGRVISTVYCAFVSEEKLTTVTLKGDDDVKDHKWINIGGRVQKLGFDHNKIVKDLVAKICSSIMNSPIAFEFLNTEFTWRELQDVYEAILGKELVTSNFRRKMMDTYLISEVNKSVPIARGRSPKLLVFEGVQKIF